jgi:hypothetical protein
MEVPTKPQLAGPTRPLGSREIPQFHLPAKAGAGQVYAPWLYGAATIHFHDRRRRIDETRRVAYRVPLLADTRAIDWEVAVPEATPPSQLLEPPVMIAAYQPLPAGAMAIKTFTRWARGFDRWLARTQRLSLPAVEGVEPERIAPKRGGVSVELVAIVWCLT